MPAKGEKDLYESLLFWFCHLLPLPIPPLYPVLDEEVSEQVRRFVQDLPWTNPSIDSAVQLEEPAPDFDGKLAHQCLDEWRRMSEQLQEDRTERLDDMEGFLRGGYGEESTAMEHGDESVRSYYRWLGRMPEWRAWLQLEEARAAGQPWGQATIPAEARLIEEGMAREPTNLAAGRLGSAVTLARQSSGPPAFRAGSSSMDSATLLGHSHASGIASQSSEVPPGPVAQFTALSPADMLATLTQNLPAGKPPGSTTRWTELRAQARAGQLLLDGAPDVRYLQGDQDDRYARLGAEDNVVSFPRR